MTTIDSQTPASYMHLHVDPDAKKAADRYRAAMPAHFYARGIPYHGGCEYSERRGGPRCCRPADHPIHLPPAS